MHLNVKRWFVPLVILFFVLSIHGQNFECPETCRMEVVETIPDGMTSELNHISTYDNWKALIDNAKTTIEIGSYYWTLQAHYEYDHATANLGKQIYDSLLAAANRNVTIKIVKSVDEPNFPNHDPKDLVQANKEHVEVRDLNFTRLIGSGIIHTKMMIVDRQNIYVGSSNFDWRALTQVKEIGISGTNCPCLGEDLGKTFDVYWYLGENETITVPEVWDSSFESPFNKSSPMAISFSGQTYNSYIGSAPPQFCPNGRTTDLDAIYDVIDTAENFVHIAVMDYFPLIMFDGPLRLWPDLENKLKSAAIDRRIKVKLLMAKWSNTRDSAQQFLTSLRSVNGSYAWVDIQVRMYVVPANEDQSKIPYSRVNHNKYVVTDKSAYFGTSNWSGDYFISSGGIGVVVSPTGNATGNDIRTQLAQVFDRDWNSENSKSLEEIYNEARKLSSAIIYTIVIAFVVTIYF